MSLPRSIDQAQISGAPVTLVTTAETIVLSGPNLQTPKDTSIVALLGVFMVTLGASATAITLRVRLGATVTGTVVGAPAVLGGLTAPVSVAVPIFASIPQNFTDYCQLTVTAQQTAATGNGSVTGGGFLVVSF